MYKVKKSPLGKFMSGALAVAMLVSMSDVSAFAAAPTTAGTYDVDATLTCYVNAMGGVEFSDGYGLLKGTTVNIDESGNATATLTLGTTSGLSVYGVACTAFIGVDEAPGYYKSGSVTKEGVTYVSSEDTVANSSGQVNYITSITMPVDTDVEEYTMWLYLDSNVMGCQLGDGTGSGASNTPGVTTKHTSKFSIDWDSAKTSTGAGSDTSTGATSTKKQSATVEYTVEGGYEVEIPSTIKVNTSGNQGNYIVEAKNFTIPEGGYVTVSASESGELVNGLSKLKFTNTLSGNKLQKDGDSLTGTIKITDTPSNPGKYVGTIDFTINYFAGK